MIFIYTIDKVLSGEQTQTRRIVRDGEYIEELYYDGYQMYVYTPSRRCVYGTFHSVLYPTTYAVQPGRGKKAVARIQIVNIRREDVRQISDEDVKAEGFDNKLQFLETWVRIHDHPMTFFAPSDYPELNTLNLGTPPDCYRQWLGRSLKWQDRTGGQVFDSLLQRPADRYQAWAITFKLVQP